MGPFDAVKRTVVEACLDLAGRGYLAGIGGNVALRAGENCFAVTPSAADYYSMKPEDVVILDLTTLAVLEGERSPSVESALHAKLLRARPDLNASVHTHQPVASAMALLNRAIPLEDPEERAALGAQVAITPYGPSGTGMLARAFGRTLRADVNAYLLRNHGVVCGGEDMARAIRNVALVERAAARHLEQNVRARTPKGLAATLRERVLASLQAELRARIPAAHSGRIEVRARRAPNNVMKIEKPGKPAPVAASAVSQWPDTDDVFRRLKALLKLPPRGLRPENRARVMEYFETRCRKSRTISEEAARYIPGGVQHNLAFNYPFPLAINQARGAYLRDVDGNQYIDFLQAGGPTLLGSNYEPVQKKVIELIKDCGPVTGLLHEYEHKLAAEVGRHMTGIEMFRMLGSGTEGVMAAIRLARAYTGKKRVVKIGGGYHGWSDQMVYGMRIPGAGAREATGIPAGCLDYTQECFPNDIAALKRKLRLNQLRGGTAAVIVEPFGPESGTRPIYFEYNRQVRELCDQFGALLIFDEVVTGFRAGLGGAQGYFGVQPDITVFGKCLTGGYPMAGGIGGRREIMMLLAGGISAMGKRAFVGGTLSANPLSCAAGYFSLQAMERTNAAVKAGQAGDRLTRGLKEIIERRGLPYVVYNQGSIVHLQTSAVLLLSMRNPIKVLREAKERKHVMEEMGAAYTAHGLITLAGSRIYTSLADTDAVIDRALDRFDAVFALT